MTNVLLRLASLHAPRQLLQGSKLGLILVLVPVLIPVSLAPLLGAFVVGLRFRVVRFREVARRVDLESK